MIAPHDWQRVSDAFHRALEQPAAERARFVREYCGGDEALRTEVESLLAAHENVDGFLSTPAGTLRSATGTSRQLAAGSRLGHFEVAGLIGKGGMGEVYRARDTRLDRVVAIKLLAPDLAADAAGRERFEREARLISKLTHPHICTLHDVGSAVLEGEDVQYLVMEYVEGETLSARLQRGALPVAEALAVGVQIAEALVAAHAAGVVHRDLKPSNIMLTRTGAKLLDFGLARLRSTGLGERDGAGSSAALTNAGAIVGTLAYMAPEQVRGEPADPRSEVFAFGAVLYEMVTGTRAFAAGSQTALVAAILERDPPPLTGVEPLAPASLERVVTTCLAKDPDDRWQSSADLLRALTWVRDDETRGARKLPVRGPAAKRDRTLWVAAAMVMIGLGLGAFYSWPPRPAPPRQISFPVYAPPGTTFPRGTSEMALSPDGSALAFVAVSEGTRRLWVRPFTSVDARPLSGTEHATLPFWSPDGRSIGYFASNKLMRIDADGGSLRVLCEVRIVRGGAWSREGTILFGANGILQRIADTGGTPAPVTTLDKRRRERAHAWPAFLPDGRTFLYLSLSTDPAENALYRGALDSTGTARVLTTGSGFVVAGSELFSLINRSLVVHAFDGKRGEVAGEPRQLVDRVGVDVRVAQAGFTVVSDGALAYRSVGDQSHLTWFDRQGKVLGSLGETADFHHASLAPDERRVAIEKTDSASGRHTIWVVDFERGTSSRLINDPFGAHGPVWSRDGSRVLFGSNRFGGLDLYTMRADGVGAETLVLRSEQGVMQRAVDWSSDGTTVIYEADEAGQTDLWMAPVASPRQPRRFLESRANETQAQLSPDMRWLAYSSNETGSYEVYIRRYPDGEAKWRVSTHGGGQPRWRGDGKELFYLAPDGFLMAADVKATAETIETGAAQQLFNTGVRGMFTERRNHYVVTRDGQRFLVNVMDEDDTTAPITVVTNWRALGR